jgi:hypothetical protein
MIATRRRRRVPGMLAAAAVAMSLTCATHLLAFGVWDLEFRLLDSGYEWSYTHLLATAAFAAGAVLCWAGSRRAVEHERAWWSASLLFGILLIDNVTRLHERVPTWPLVFVPLLVGLALALTRVAGGTPQAGAIRAGIVLLSAALTIHVFGPAVLARLGWSADTWAYQVPVAIKEATEVTGWVMVVPSLRQLLPPPR